MLISIVIPACDEAAMLPATLRALAEQAAPHEIIVVDGGSTDATPAITAAAGAKVIVSPRRQRAAQMNLGAAAARGEALLFLHADTRLAPGSLEAIEAALQRPEIIGGGFARRYDSGSWLLLATCVLAEARTRACGWFLGDQAIFARSEVFAKAHGFREWDVFEDLDFSRRMARTGRVVTLHPPVVSAARRFAARGAARTTWGDVVLTARYLAGQLPAARPNAPARTAGNLCAEP